jgi:predicted ATPase/DNA-binding winged helix-turn-helix (wHTH) protein
MPEPGSCSPETAVVQSMSKGKSLNVPPATQSTTESAETVFVFGPYRLRPALRVLMKADRPVPIGSRALEVLIALIERPGELVSKEELFARAWPHTLVEESSLRAQVAALRRVLQESAAGASCIAAVPGQGYRFVAEVSREQLDPRPPVPTCAATLPVRLNPVIGRTEAIAMLERRLQRCRFVTLVGPGGVGKTTVAVATATQSSGSYRDGVCFVDVAALEAHLLPSVLASSLGLSIIADDVTQAVAEQLRPLQILIVLDNCERIVDIVAQLAERILKAAPHVHLLVTSREPLRAEGESVYRLPTLDAPPITAGLSAAEALRFPAVELFVERATACVLGFALMDAEAAVVADICRQLDGIPLAIELAAGRVDAYSLRGIAERLDDRFRLLKGGRRTALPRHQTLLATLDWSYEVLSGDEQRLLRALSVFAGGFCFDAVSAVTATLGGIGANIADVMASLISRSLVSAEVERRAARYRLLDSTRAYARERLDATGERAAVCRSHAQCYLLIFQRALGEWEVRDAQSWLADYAPEGDNLRAALEWAFCPEGNAALGIELTIAAVPLWFRLSATDECRICVQRALARIDSAEHQEARARQVMQLYAALGLSRTFTLGLTPQAKAAWHKSLELAEQLQDREHQREALWGLWLCQIGDGDYREALATAHSFQELAEAAPDIQIAHRLIGVPRHCLGDHAGARGHIEHGLDTCAPPSPAAVRFRYGQPMAARVILAQMLWLQGFPDQAMQAAHRSVAECRATGHAISHCDALAQALVPIALHVGDHETAAAAITVLAEMTDRYALGPWQVLSKCWAAVLQIAQGAPGTGIEQLFQNLELLREARFSFYRTQFMGTLAAAFAERGDAARGLAMIEAALDRCQIKEEFWCLPEILRLKGRILSVVDAGNRATAEDLYLESLVRAREQKALSWELRAATTLADLKRRSGLLYEARETVVGVYGRFTEGFATADLRAARQFIGIPS